MKTAVKFFVKRPLLVNIIFLAVVLLGVRTLANMNKESFPRISQNQALITAIYPGASSEDVEINVTIPIEEALEEVAGIQEMISLSRESASSVTVLVDDNASPEEFAKIYDEIEAAISRIDDFPAELESAPIIKQITSDDIPILELALTGDYKTLSKFVPDLKNRIRKVSGVAGITTIGLPDEEVEILVDPVKAKQLSVDLKTIAGAIGKRNLQGSGGSLESFLTDKKVVAYNKFEKYSEVLDTNIRRSFTGYGVKLRDLATLRLSPKDQKLQVRSNGQKGASLLITKKPGADILATVDGIQAILDKSTYPAGVEVAPLNDQSYLTRERLKLLVGNSLIGFALVLIMLFAVFGFRTALWTAAGIPFSLLGLFILLPSFGITLNSITLGGCVIVLGMLVDDAIVVAEQIAHFREQGESPLNAAVLGVQKMYKPVLASSLTTMIAFTPMLQLGGLPGKFVWIIPLVVCLALMVSLFESYFLLPSHLGHGDHDKPAQDQKRGFVLLLEKYYARLLSLALRFRYFLLAGFVLMFLGAGLIANKLMQKEPFPQEAAEGFLVRLDVPGVIKLKNTETILGRVERELLKLPETELSGFSARIGTHSPSPTADRGVQNNLAIIFVYLTPYSRRNRTAEDIMDELRKKLAGIQEANLALELIRLGPPVGRPFEIRLSINDDRLRAQKGQEVKDFLKTVPGVFEIEDDVLEGKQELNLKVNHDLLAQAGLTAEDLLLTLRIAFDGVVVTSLTRLNGVLDFRLRLNEKARADENFLARLPITNRQGYVLNLKNFITIEQRSSRAEIRHIDGARTLAIYGQVDKEKITPDEVVRLVQEKFSSERDGVVFDYAGEPRENKKIFGNLALAGITALVGVFLVVAIIFNSITRPFIVLAAIPFGIVGVILSLYIHGKPLSMFAIISLIGLTGVIVNDSIVMVYTLTGSKDGEGAQEEENEAKNPGEDTIHGAQADRSDAVIIPRATSRLRPILLTTLTTAAGLLPTAYGIGGSDPFISPMCLALGYGLLFGTTIILFLIPCLYRIGGDIQNFRNVLESGLRGLFNERLAATTHNES